MPDKSCRWQGFDVSMVKRRKTTPTKGARLAALKRAQPRPPADDEGPDQHWDPHRPIGPDWKPRVPARPLPRPRVGGPPAQDPGDIRSDRYAMRMHPHLRAELVSLARQRGWKASQWIEKALIDAVNRERGSEVLDQIGRYRAESDE